LNGKAEGKGKRERGGRRKEKKGEREGADKKGGQFFLGRVCLL